MNNPQYWLLSYNRSSSSLFFPDWMPVNHTHTIIHQTLCRRLHGGLTSWWNMQRRFCPSTPWTWMQRWKSNLRTAGTAFLSSSCSMTIYGLTVRTNIFYFRPCFKTGTRKLGQNINCFNIMHSFLWQRLNTDVIANCSFIIFKWLFTLHWFFHSFQQNGLVCIDPCCKNPKKWWILMQSIGTCAKPIKLKMKFQMDWLTLSCTLLIIAPTLMVDVK